MYYIQNYRLCTSSAQRSVDRFLVGEYMGAAEFEWGSVPTAWQWLRQARPKLFKHVAKTNGLPNEEVFFYVITDETGFEQFKEKIDALLDGSKSGLQTKCSTNLWDKFGSKANMFGRETEAWLSVSDFVSRAFSENKPIEFKPGNTAIFFTANEKLATRTMLELYRDHADFNTYDLHIGDKVYCHLQKVEAKVSALNEDDSIGVKFAHSSKSFNMNPRDIWPVEAVLRIPQLSAIFNPQECRLD